ncbi:MAG: site-specific DNA-methyltransferase [Alphaproteobacteria bacterium]|nr:site-specific DNA-methyltransferase [Alphaproteobacteria bacterium]
MTTPSRNKTISITDTEQQKLQAKLQTDINVAHVNADSTPKNQLILGDFFTLAPKLPKNFVDLLILDPPYNLAKKFGDNAFKQMSIDDYSDYIDNILRLLIPCLKPTASIYLCGDWLSSTSLHQVASRYFHIRNRITWQREKGRGAKSNWKNAHEDIWFCTQSANFTFNVDLVKTRKKVIAPYRVDGKPKDWQETEQGNFRDTHPSNFWDDITVPYWSMAENTNHPTQKPEKLMAKLILASSQKGDMVLDPFMGVGTSCVVAKKLERHYLGFEIDPYYACVAQKRIDLAQKRIDSIDDADDAQPTIQGYHDGVFWERNSLNKKLKRKNLIGIQDIIGVE